MLHLSSKKLILVKWVVLSCLALFFTAQPGFAAKKVRPFERKSSDRGRAIYQAFNERFADTKGRLEYLKNMGFTAIQVSPPNKSADLSEWWGRYQPVDYREISGPLGNEGELAALIKKAHELNLVVVIDVVLNHMASSRYFPTLNYPQFSPWDFHDPEHRPCLTNSNNRHEVTHFWLCDNRASLPDLDTSSNYVRNVHKTFLRKLVAMGADGFRFDAAKHIEPEFFSDVLAALPENVRNNSYGEVIATNRAEADEYLGMMSVTDFQFLGSMIGAFGLGGDLRGLNNPESRGAALPAKRSIVFARNHDSAMNAGFFQFTDMVDAYLATAFVLVRKGGVPFVFNADISQKIVTSAVAFHSKVNEDSSEYFRNGAEVCTNGASIGSGSTAKKGSCDSPNLLFIERGNNAVAIINKSSEWIDAPAARFAGLQTGCYKELNYGFSVELTRGGDNLAWSSSWGTAGRGGLNLGPRTAFFLVRESDPGRCFKR